MSVGTLTLRWPGILIEVLDIAAVLTACSDSPKPEEDTATICGDSGAWEEYEAFCSEATQEELDDYEDYTNGEVSTFYTGLIERMESLDPPGEIADWHDRVLAGWTAMKKLNDAEPQDAIFDPFILFSDSEILFLFGEVEEAFNEIPADVRERLATAGCTDDADSEPIGQGESDMSQPDATATADSGPTSTVLLDLMLPGVDGIELTKTVPELSDVPVIFLSAYGRDQIIARALEAGASGLSQTAAAISTLAATSRALPAIPRPSVDGSPIERTRRFLNTLG